MRLPVAVFPFLVLAGMGEPVGAGVRLVDAGFLIDAGAMGSFTLSWPALDVAGKTLKPIEKQLAGQRAVLTYEGGGKVTVVVSGDGLIELTCAGLPAGTRSLRCDMLIDYGFSEGGRWRIGESEGSFPAQQPEKPFLFQGNAERFELIDSQGRRLHFAVPRYSYQQLQDNREWNWKIYAWFFAAPYDARNPRLALSVEEALEAARPVVVCDRFGQDAAVDFPGKVRSEEELRADVHEDERYYAALALPPRNDYGGRIGSGAALGLRRTGYFHIERVGERWLLVDPDGEACFHLGICAFQPSDDYTYIKGRQEIYEWLPPYDGEFHTAFHTNEYWSRDAFSFYIANVIRKYGRPFDREEWTARMIDRVRRLGFNATGAFSGATRAHRDKRFPWVSMLPLNEWQLGRHIPGLRGIFDPFDTETAAKMDRLFAETVAPNAEEPLLIGYFLANEQAFEDLTRVIPTLQGAPAKQALAELLRERYRSVEAFNEAWGTTLTSLDELASTGLPVSTARAAEDMQAYKERFLERYYGLIANTFRKFDAHHLLLGDRWQPRTANDELLCRTAGRYCDVLSVNYYTYALDGAFLRRLHGWGGRPLMLSEFYWASPNDTGLPGGNEVAGQRERGLAYRNYVEGAAALGFVVGIEWFTLVDQARTGRWFERYSGEKANTGLFSVTDRPYREMLAEAIQTNLTIEDVMLGRRAPFVFDHPRFRAAGPSEKTLKVPRALGAIALDGRRDDWPGVPPELVPGSRVVLGAEAGGVEGAFRLCWDDTALYLLAHVTDPTPMRNEQTASALWNADAIELFLGPEAVDQGGALRFTDRQVLLGAGREPRVWIVNAPQQGPLDLVVVADADGGGYTVEAAIPFATLGFTPRPGLTIRFDLAIDDGRDGKARQRQLVWNGDARNSGDRTGWGRAVFVE